MLNKRIAVSLPSKTLRLKPIDRAISRAIASPLHLILKTVIGANFLAYPCYCSALCGGSRLGGLAEGTFDQARQPTRRVFDSGVFYTCVRGSNPACDRMCALDGEGLMCGIAGLSRPRRPFDIHEGERLVRSMLDRLVHRGPDADGLWCEANGRCILGHRRLSIIDPSDAGRQPFRSHDGRWVITFNGEIYNFQELKPIIERAGGQVRGRTDTEVLVESLALWGVEAFAKLDGMFALAAYDTVTGDIILARDAFGEKPLYLMELADGGVAFASEVHALECLPEFNATIDLGAMAEVLCFQYIGAPRSIYRGIKNFAPVNGFG
jgi:hypothetical protein